MRRRAVVVAILLAAMAITARAAAPDPIEIAAGVYLVRGTGGTPDAANLGRIGNTGFIVGPTGVLAIDAGASAAHAAALLDAIRGVTDRPVRLVILTNPRPEFALGASTFRDRGIPIAMHQAAAAALAARFDIDLAALSAAAGDGAAAGTRAVVPDLVFADPLTVDAAAMIGRPVQILDIGVAIGPGDVAVFDPRSRTLFAGALVEAGRLPDLADGPLADWRDVLGTLKALPIEEIVPGHGAADDLRMVVRMDRYLVALASMVEPAGPGRDTALTDFTAWDGYARQQPRNVEIVRSRSPPPRRVTIAPAAALPPR